MKAKEKPTVDMVVSLSVDDIVVDENPRKDFDKTALKELQASIETHGIIEPLVVRMKDGKDHLVAGERRLRAAKAAGLKYVPTVNKVLTDDQVLEMQLIENLQREGLAPLEEANAVKTLLARGISQREVATMIGKSEGWVSARARMGELPHDTKALIKQGKLGVEQAVMLLPYKDYPIITEMEKNMKDQLEYTGTLGPKPMKDDVINDALSNPTFARDLVNFGQSWQDDGKRLKAAFDVGPCKKCPERREVPSRWDPKQKKVICLKKDCWSKKMKEARKAVRATRKVSREKKEEKGELTVSDLHWWSELKGEKFDQTDCKKCDKVKKVKAYGGKMIRVCTNQSCFQKKENERSRAVKEYATAFRNNVGVRLGICTEPTLRAGERRLLLELALEDARNPDIIKAALKPWMNRSPKKGWPGAARTLPEHAVLPALFRLTILKELKGLTWNPEAADKLKNKLEPLTPLLLEGFDPKKAKADAKAAAGASADDDEPDDDGDDMEMGDDEDPDEGE